MAFSPDGRYLAAGDSRGFHLWDLSTGLAPLWSIKGNYIARDFCFALDSAAVLGGRAEHYRYDVRTGVRTVHQLPEGIHPDQFSPDNRFAAAVYPNSARGILQLLCARAVAGQWEEAWRKELARDPVEGYTVRFSADGGRLVRVRRRGSIQRTVPPIQIEMFDSDTGDFLAEWAGNLPLTTWETVVSPTGVIVLLRDSVFYVINTTDPASKHAKHRNSSVKHFTSIAFSRDGKRLATTSNDTAATIWDAITWEVRHRYEWQIGRLRTVCFAPDGLRCAAGSETGQIVVWDLD
jgi:WD40 repeat protein